MVAFAITFALASDGEIGGMEGCYLFHNDETGDFVRSGKAVGADRSFLERYKEHKHHATTQGVNDLDSFFYHSYPSKQAGCIGDRMARKGYFENLSLHCGLGFSRDHLHPAIYESSGGVDAPQLFKWDKYVLERFGTENSVKEKKLHFVGYLLELCYDLALSNDHNVSRSPGFETPLGFFPK
jgi:hypothetical protein